MELVQSRGWREIVEPLPKFGGVPLLACGPIAPRAGLTFQLDHLRFDILPMLVVKLTMPTCLDFETDLLLGGWFSWLPARTCALLA